jgi:hypothetical protein
MDITEIVCDHVDGIISAEHRDWWQAHVNTVTNFWIPKKVGIFFWPRSVTTYCQDELCSIDLVMNQNMERPMKNEAT